MFFFLCMFENFRCFDQTAWYWSKFKIRTLRRYRITADKIFEKMEGKLKTKFDEYNRD